MSGKKMPEQGLKSEKKHTGFSRAKEFCLGFVKQISSRDIVTYAASAAFFILLSFLPLTIFLMFFLPKTGLSAEEVIPVVTDVTPDYIDAFVAQIIREAYGRAGGIVPLTLIITIISAMQGMTALMRGLRHVYGIEKKQNVLFQNLLSFLSTLVIAVFLFASALGLFLTNSVVLASAAQSIPIPILSESVLRLRFLIMLVLFIVLLTALYTLISGSERKIRLHIPGAVLASVLCAVFTAFFSLYVGLGNYRTIYGSLATLVVMMIWGYFCIYLILLGGSFNQYRMDLKEKGNTQEGETDGHIGQKKGDEA